MIPAMAKVSCVVSNVLASHEQHVAASTKLDLTGIIET